MALPSSGSQRYLDSVMCGASDWPMCPFCGEEALAAQYPSEAVEVGPWNGICTLIISRTALVSLQTPSNVPGTAVPLKEQRVRS